MRSVTLTHFVNRSSDGELESAPLTPRQLYAGLKLKARDGRAFVSAIERCEVSSETETGLLRIVHFKGKPEPVQERVEFFPPTTAEFTMLSPAGETVARITNIVSMTPGGDVLLTFTFAFGPNGPEEVGEVSDKEAQRLSKLADETIARTIKVIRELAQEGKLGEIHGSKPST